MKRDFSRIAIVNRGEAAMRLINAVRELNAEACGRYRTIALYTEPDAHAMFVREADEAYPLGPPLVRDPGTGQERTAYVDLDVLSRALVGCRADAVWPGWGFVAESPEFVELCDRLGIVFIGPPADAMRRLGDKLSAKALARRLGVPVIPGGEEPVSTVEEAIELAGRIGYPIMLKSAGGGGGRGLRRVGDAHQLAAAFPRASAEAAKAFGIPTLFLERLLEGVRHVELQMLADAHGTVWAVGTRDCSLQRRHQKVLEEAPAPDLPEDVGASMKEAACRLLREAGYRNACTVETLYDAAERRWYFLEVNTRLQVEHPVTELTTGLDLVKLQIAVAHGEPLSGEPPAPSGHAVEVRLNAEDPDLLFAPAPGTFVLFRLPTGPGLRIDRGVTEGDSVPPQFDSMVAKLVAHGRTRREAMARLARALAESAVLIDGGTTNKSYLLHLLNHDEVKAGPVDIAWLERNYRREAAPPPNAAASLVMAALEIDATERARELKEFFVSAARLRPQVPEGVGRRVELRHGGQTYAADVFRRGPGECRVFLDGRYADARVDVLGRFERWLDLGGRRYRMLSLAQEPVYRVEADGIPHAFARDDGGIVRASSPAVVVSVAVKAGDEVRAGDPIAVLEAMKMETTVVSPAPGRVREVFAIPNSQVAPGAPLCQLDATAARPDGPEKGAATLEPAGSPAARIALPRAVEAAPDAASRCADLLELARHLVLGYDVDPATSRRLAEDYGQDCGGLPPDDADRLRAEDEVLRIFCDVASLFRRTPADAEAEAETVSSSEYFLIYLRTLSADVSRLPSAFLDRLRRALAWFGVPDLSRGQKLEDALLCLYRSRQRADLSVPVVTAILERRLRHVRELVPFASPAHRRLLDRLAYAAERRHPIVADLVNELRFSLFDAPLFERRRQEVWAAAEEHLDVLARDAASPEREARVRALVDCPETLKNLLAGRFEAASPALRHLMLEVMTRRYYRIREILTFSFDEAGPRSVAHAQYELEGRRVHVLTTYGPKARLLETARDLVPVLDSVPEGHDVVVDLFLWDDDPPGDADGEAAALSKALEEVAFPRPVRRIVAIVSGPAERPTRHYTFRSPAVAGDATGPRPIREERFYRNLHPMVGKRFQLWRLLAFDIERLPSAEEVFLFRAVARDNPKDERLFAFGEVRDMTPVLDDAGRIVQLPYLTRILTEALAAIRSQLARKRPEERPQWNQVLLNVWPPFTTPLAEVNSLAARLAPAAAGLGIEKVSVLARTPHTPGGPLVDTLLELSNPGGTGLSVAWKKPDDSPILTLSEYELKVARMRQRGLPYPYEIIEMLTPAREGTSSDLPPGIFLEYDVDPAGALVPVSRPYGRNTANNVVGVLTSYTAKHPEGLRRVLLLGDPSREMGSIAEPECRRVLGALDLAQRLKLPLEWFAISAGAKISTESGTENMDWISKVLRRIVEFTQAGGEINVVVTGINVGAQPYWNSEATMLMHTRGILIMTADGAMVLTGKTALDYSGSVSAEDNHGIGGYDRVMGPNGQAQYFAPDIHAACQLLMRHYDHTYVAPGERFPRRCPTTDPFDRDVCRFPHGGDLFETVGDVFGDEKNAGRKKPFDIRKVMLSVTDQDHPPLERWPGMRDAEIAVVWDAHVGGYPVCLLGLESRPLTRLGFVPADGPDHWTSGTLFPFSSKKVARAVNSASGNRPLVILANLSGFDGSPESMRKLQLEYGAEIGRAVVNFRGPIVFCVVSRYHGGAFVVFSRTLNDNMEAVALEGTYASVIGGAPAAAVVFAREVDARTRKDPRLAELEKRIAGLAADAEAERRRLKVRLAELRTAVRSEKLGEVADEFDGIHSVQRALRTGSLDRIIPPQTLRPYLVGALERGMARELARTCELVTT